MTPSKFILGVLLLISQKIVSQKEASQLYFGLGSGLNLLTTPPSAINNSSISAIEGSASIADENGNLLFYTNGRDVWNSVHNLMSGTLPGDPSSVQSAVIFKKSGSLYYVFTAGQLGTGPLGCSIIDMSMNAGLGGIQNTSILQDSITERMAAVRHCNGIDTWVLVHKNGDDRFLSYLVGPTTISTTPVVSNVGAVLNYSVSDLGSFEFSPNGKLLAVTRVITSSPSYYVIFELHGFDSQTGVVSSPTLISVIPNQRFIYSKFSPDGTKLYANLNSTNSGPASIKYVVQWDVCAGTPAAISASQNTVGVLNITTLFSYVGGIQTGLDGKLYYPIKNFAGSIDSPNAYGSACNFVQPYIPLNPNGLSGFGSCEFVSSLFRQKADFTHSTNCGLVQFTCNAVNGCSLTASPINNVKWFFGDGTSTSNTSTLNSPQHNYSANGTYTVKMIAQYDCFTDTTFKLIQITSLPNLSITGKNNVCKGDLITYTLAGASSFSWNSNSVSNTIAMSANATTVYSLSGINSPQNCAATKLFTLNVLPCTNVFQNEVRDDFLRIHPNPGIDFLNLESSQDAVISIYNCSGQLVLNCAIHKGLQQIDLSNLAKGLYFIRSDDFSKNAYIKLVLE